MPITIRRITRHDAERLREVRLAALADSPTAFSSRHEDEAQRPAEAWADRAALGETGRQRVTFFAEDGETAVGLVGGYRENETDACVELVSMWTASTHRRAGVGRALVQAVLTWAAETGAASVGLGVMSGNEPAEALYRSMGFVPAGEVPLQRSDRTSVEVRMLCQLRSPAGPPEPV